jgi:hypothetical protein
LPCIPLGCFLSINLLVLANFGDKFNLIKKKNLLSKMSKEISVTVIELLEISVLFFALGILNF